MKKTLHKLALAGGAVLALLSLSPLAAGQGFYIENGKEAETPAVERGRLVSVRSIGVHGQSTPEDKPWVELTVRLEGGELISLLQPDDGSLRWGQEVEVYFGSGIHVAPLGQGPVSRNSRKVESTLKNGGSNITIISTPNQEVFKVDRGQESIFSPGGTSVTITRGNQRSNADGPKMMWIDKYRPGVQIDEYGREYQYQMDDKGKVWKVINY